MTAGGADLGANDLPTPAALRWFWPVLALLLLLRLCIDGSLVLLPDESVYWSWSRHLSLGYLDHPPMIAWLSWLSTHLLGQTELAVRLPSALLAYGAVAIIVCCIAPRLIPGAAGRNLLAFIWLTSPMLLGFGTIATPDTPVFFFSTCALGCIAMIAMQDERGELLSSTLGPVDPDLGAPHLSGSAGPGVRGISPAWFWWILFGLFTGLALLSKYTAVLVPAAATLWLLTSRTGWAHLRRPWFYLAALVALVIFSPVIYWNYRHGWASFSFQLHHGMNGDYGADAPPVAIPKPHVIRRILINAGSFLGGQALLWTPVLFVLGLIAIVRGWWRIVRLDAVDRLLLWTASVNLALFFVASLRKTGEINWPSFTYVPLSILIVRQAYQRWNRAVPSFEIVPLRAATVRERETSKLVGSRKAPLPDGRGSDKNGWAGWIHQGCKVAIGFAIGMHLLLLPQTPRLLSRLHLRPPHNITDLHAPWPGMGALIAERARGALIVCNRHQDAGEIAFYVPGHPAVWCDGVGSRATAFDYFPNPPDFAHMRRLLFVGGHEGEFAAKHHYPPAHLEKLTAGGGSQQLVRAAALFTMTGAPEASETKSASHAESTTRP